MKIEVQVQNQIAILQLQGEFTVESLKSFEDAVSNARTASPRGLLLDMSRVILMDSAALEQLLTLHEDCRKRNQPLKLAGLDETCQKILEITRLLSRLDTYADLSEAMKSFV
ncbi:MAG: STAS domain-containing protein [Anaerohalosphaeraceae bacterium]